MAMNSTITEPPDQAAVALFHSLSDAVRLRIIRLLSDGERRVVELTSELGLAQSTVSGHLACLRAAGLIDAHPHGRSTYYALTRPELWALLAAAEKLLDADGATGTLCPDHHRPEPAAVCSVAVRGCLLHEGSSERRPGPGDRVSGRRASGDESAEGGSGHRSGQRPRPGRH